MKKNICKILIVFGFLLATSFSCYSFSSTELIINDSVNIEKIQLIEDYITQHKNKIELFAEKYEIKNSTELNAMLSDLSDMIIILRKLKNNSIHQEKRNEIVEKIVAKLKSINKDIKPLLKIKKDIFEKKLQKQSDQYSILGIKLYKQLYSIILNAASNLNKRNLNEAEKKTVIVSLIALEKESKKLKNFSSIPFTSEAEMRESFIRILKNIKRELINIKLHY